MYNLQLSPEQLEIRDTVRDFVAQKVKPVALRPERLEARTRPLLADVLDKASQLGLRTLTLSEDAGGAGADTLTSCIVTEELALGDPDVAAVLAQTSALARVLFDRLMTPEQRARFLPPFLADDRYHLAHAYHEPDHDAALGISYHRPETSDAAAKTTAVRTGDAWVINGVKDRIANAPLAKLFAVEVRSGADGATTILVPRDAPGLSVNESDRNGHFHHGVCGRLAFKDCRVPVENLVSTEGVSPLAGDAARELPQDHAPPMRRRSTTRNCGCRADAASSSIRRSEPSWPRSLSGSRSHALPSGRRRGLVTIRKHSPTAACPICRSRA
jgi:alkylation response protein AidB-like acyl-CoA dehydrogenase